jgi:hypothetical protein
VSGQEEKKVGHIIKLPALARSQSTTLEWKDATNVESLHHLLIMCHVNSPIRAHLLNCIWGMSHWLQLRKIHSFNQKLLPCGTPAFSTFPVLIMQAFINQQPTLVSDSCQVRNERQVHEHIPLTEFAKTPQEDHWTKKKPMTKQTPQVSAAIEHVHHQKPPETCCENSNQT